MVAWMAAGPGAGGELSSTDKRMDMSARRRASALAIAHAAGRGSREGRRAMIALRILMAVVLAGLPLGLLLARRGPARTDALVQAVIRASIYGGAGPPLGAALLVAPAVASEPWNIELALVVVAAMLGAYGVGLVPAIWAGGCMGAMRAWLPAWLRPIASALLCMLGTLALGITFFADALIPILQSSALLGMLGAAVGVLIEVAALVVRLVFARPGTPAPNRSTPNHTDTTCTSASSKVPRPRPPAMP
jgi:hypothetical protein